MQCTWIHSNGEAGCTSLHSSRVSEGILEGTNLFAMYFLCFAILDLQLVCDRFSRRWLLRLFPIHLPHGRHTRVSAEMAWKTTCKLLSRELIGQAYT